MGRIHEGVYKLTKVKKNDFIISKLLWKYKMYRSKLNMFKAGLRKLVSLPDSSIKFPNSALSVNFKDETTERIEIIRSHRFKGEVTYLYRFILLEEEDVIEEYMIPDPINFELDFKLSPSSIIELSHEGNSMIL